MAIERLERQLNRRQFLAGLGLSSISALLAREAILKSQHESSPGVSTGTGPTPAIQNLTELSIRNHADLQNVTSDQHHTRAHSRFGAGVLDHSDITPGTPVGGEIDYFDTNTLLWTLLLNPGAGMVLKHDGINPYWAGLASAPQYHNTRRTTTYTNATTTFTDVFTLTHNPNPSPRMFWAYAVARVDAAGTVGELRLYDKTAAVVLGSPHPDTVYTVNGRTVNASECLMGRDAGTLPIGNHTLALQGRVTVSGTLTVDKAGLYGFRENSFTSG